MKIAKIDKYVFIIIQTLETRIQTNLSLVLDSVKQYAYEILNSKDLKIQNKVRLGQLE